MVMQHQLRVRQARLALNRNPVRPIGDLRSSDLLHDEIEEVGLVGRVMYNIVFRSDTCSAKSRI